MGQARNACDKRLPQIVRNVQKPQKTSRHAQKLVGLVVELDLSEITASELLSHRGQNLHRVRRSIRIRNIAMQSYTRSELQHGACNNYIVPVM